MRPGCPKAAELPDDSSSVRTSSVLSDIVCCSRSSASDARAWRARNCCLVFLHGRFLFSRRSSCRIWQHGHSGPCRHNCISQNTQGLHLPSACNALPMEGIRSLEPLEVPVPTDSPKGAGVNDSESLEVGSSCTSSQVWPLALLILLLLVVVSRIVRANEPSFFPNKTAGALFTRRRLPVRKHVVLGVVPGSLEDEPDTLDVTTSRKVFFTMTTSRLPPDQLYACPALSDAHQALCRSVIMPARNRHSPQAHGLTA